MPASLRMSVVIPAFNEADDLGATLTALSQQDFTGRFEVIVVDNNSTDDTATVAERYGARVVHEPHPGVCAARQTGTRAARGDIVVSTDADSVQPPGWLTRLDAQFRAHDDAVAVAGPCRYQDPPWWAAVFPPLWFAAVAAVHRVHGGVFYVTATNLAFRRSAFPGYDTALTLGGDEVDFLRRLRRRGPVVWDAENPVLTSSRRMEQGLVHTVVVSFGYYYAYSYLLTRLSLRRRMVPAPAIRRQDTALVRRRRTRWRVASLVLAAGVGLVARTGSGRPVHPFRRRRPLRRSAT